MTAGSDHDRLEKLIETGSRQACLDFLAGKSPEERRSFAKLAHKKYKDADRAWLSDGGNPQAKRRGRNSVWDEQENAKVCLFAAATSGELKKLGWRAVPHDGFIVDVIRTLQPDWANDWAQHLVDNEPRMFNNTRLLYEAGLCDKPTSDGYILGMIESLPGWIVGPNGLWDKDTSLADRIRNTPDIRDEDVWRLFEVEGGGDLSLATFDKYIGDKKVGGWTAALVELAADGTLSRDRLLDESLNALERDFAQFRAGWFSRFHEHLAPSLEERAARLNQYLRLLGSSIPPTVSFALKAIALLNKADRLPPKEALAHLRPVLHARAKGTVTSGLRLLGSAAKRMPDTAMDAALLATEALIHESADVQKKALDLVESLSGNGDPAVVEAMRAYAEAIAPSLRHRYEEMAGSNGPSADSEDQPLPGAPLEIVELQPITSFDELNAAWLRVLEDPSEPLEVERVIAGLARHGADRPDNFAKVVGPLVKRAGAIVKREPEDRLQLHIAWLALAYAMDADIDIDTVEAANERLRVSLEIVFARRNRDLLGQLRNGHRLPPMSTPTDNRGFVAVDKLIARYGDYKSAKIEPGMTDMALALLRLAPESRVEALAGFAPENEHDRAISFALGGGETPGEMGWLWVAAAAARRPYEDQPAIAKKHGRGNPDAGTKARYAMRFDKDHYFATVSVEPKVKDVVPSGYIPSLFHIPAEGLWNLWSICGQHANMIRWSSTVWPLNQEPFFSQGVRVFDHSQRLANSPYAAFIEPMLQSHVDIGEVGSSLLALGIASSDPAVRSVAIDAAVAAIAEGRLSLDLMRQTMAVLIPSGQVPVGRWTKALGEVSGVSGQHATFIRDLIAGSLRHDPSAPPRDIGGLVELLYELSVATSTPIDDPKTMEYLRDVKGGGKLKRFAGRLLAEG